MRKNFLICIVLCIALLMPTIASATTVAQPDTGDNTAAQTGSNSLDASVPVLGTKQIVENAEAVFLYEYTSQTLMYAWNPDVQVYPSSLVKIMTALIAIEKGTLTSEITVDQASLDAVPYDAVSAKLQAGEVLTLEQLLYCMMVGSANDAAAVIATHIAGGQDAFVQMMNQRAKELGCTGTNFVNAHGVHHENQYSTARDLAKILCAAMQQEAFARIFATPSYKVAATNMSDERNLLTSNFMLTTETMEIYYDKRVTGGRTGVSADGSRCLAVSAEENGMKMISIVLGSDSEIGEDGYTTKIYGSFNETKALLDAGLTGFKSVQILYPGQALKQFPVDAGLHKVTVGPQSASAVIVPESVSADSLTYEYVNVSQELKTPIAKGQKISLLRVWNGGVCVAQADLYALHSVHTEDQTWVSGENEAWNKVANVAGKVAIIILVVIVCTGALIAITLFLIKRFKKSALTRRIKKYRRGHRRSR